MAKKLTKAIASSARSPSAGTQTQTQTQTSQTTQQKPMVVVGNWGSLDPLTIYEASAYARSAVDAIARNLGMGKIRLFRNGKEVVSGSMLALLKTIDVEQFFTSYLIFGEAVLLNQDNKLYNIFSRNLQIVDPDMITGEYNEYILGQTGKKYTKNDIFRMLYKNPQYCFKGISPLLSCKIEAETAINAAQFNSQFFRNSGISDILFVFPRGTDEEKVGNYVAEWSAKHSLQAGNAFKASAVVSDEIQIIKNETSPRDAQFSKLTEATGEIVAGVFGVPASIMGFYNKTRFATFADEVIAFAQNCLMAHQLKFSKELTNWVNKYLIIANEGLKTIEYKANFSSGKVITNRNEGYEVLLDLDHIPIFSDLLLSKLGAIKEIMLITGVSAVVAGQYLGVDLPEAPKQIEIKPVEPAPETKETKEIEVVEKTKFEFDRKAAQLYRKEILKSFDEGRTIDILVATKIVGTKSIREVKKDINFIKKAIDTKDKKLVKDYMNAKYKNSQLQ
jgi:HK97 family phage portal protein